MARPAEIIQRQHRRIGNLHEADPVTRNGADRRKVRALGENMKAVEDEPDGGMIGTAHDLPAVAIIMDMPPPGERLVTHAQPALRRAFSQRMEIRSETINAALGIGRHV